MKKQKLLAIFLIIAICFATLSAVVACNPKDGNLPDGSNCTHVDQNNDGMCDDCHVSVLVDFDFFAINDLHGMYVTGDSQTGVEGLTTYLLNAQANGNAFVLSSGDMWQGSTESNNTKGKLATEWMNHVGCVSMTLGNHEFDWGTDYIKSNAQLASFPFLAINVYERTSDERVSYCKSSIMLEKAGVKIGVIGAIGDCYSSISASMCEDVYFKVGDELTALVKAESTKLREQGASYIIYSLHDGNAGSNSKLETLYDSEFTWYDASLSKDGYIDLVFEGHTHSSYTIQDRYGVKHVQAGGYNKGISKADVCINVANGNSTTDVSYLKNSVYSSSTESDIIDTLVTKYQDEIGNPDEVIGYNAQYRKSKTLADTMAMLYYEKGVEAWGNDYDVVLGGGYIKTRTPYNLPAGNVTMRQIQTLFPFDNSFMLCSIKGQDLLNRFFNSNHQDYHIYYGTYGAQIKSQLSNGIGLNDTYYVAVDSYSADYAPNKLTLVKNLGSDIFSRDLLVEYIKEGGFAS